jgi:hypothetical protein
MEKKFRVLRIIGTLWKILAWIVLVGGIISSLGILVLSIFGGGVMQQLGQQAGQGAFLFNAVGGIIGFVVGLISSAFYFLILYAAGEMIYLLLAIEENTRGASPQGQYQSSAPQAYPQV